MLGGEENCKRCQCARRHRKKALTTYSCDGDELVPQVLAATASSGLTFTSTSGSATCSTSPTTSYGYNAANELTSLNGSSSGWAYDGNGNETSGNSAIPRSSETYSASDQLLSGSASGTSFSATYAGLANDERVTTTAGGVTDSYQNGPEGLAVEDCGCGATYYFTRDPGGTLASERDGSSHYYYVFDGLGSVVALVNSSGTVVETDSYDPYGQTRSSTGSVNNPFDYISGFDDGTGLHHLGARYYDPALGRFTQQDPAGQQPNSYAYADGNPINEVDPAGRNAFSDFFTKSCVGLNILEAGLFIEQGIDLTLLLLGAVAMQPELEGLYGKRCNRPDTPMMVGGEGS